MKRTCQILFVLGFALLLVVVACRKVNNNRTNDVDPFNPNTTSPPPAPGTVSLNELFKDFRSTPEKQCVTAGLLQSICFAKGTCLTFYPNSFKDAAGNIITSGTVCIEMIEMYKPGDMIANVATTITTDGELLRSGGEVYISATKDGQKVYANKYGIAYRQSAASTQPMNLYYGNRSNKDSIMQWGISSGGTGTTTPFTKLDSAGAVGGYNSFYIFDSCTNFTYINCDKLNDNTSPRTEINVVITDTSYNISNTRVFLVLPEINAVTCAPFYSLTTRSFYIASGIEQHKVPIGMAIKVFVMTKKNADYYYSEQTGLTVTNNMTVTATMTKQSLDYIKTKLGAL